MGAMRALFISILLVFCSIPATADAHQFEQGKFSLGVGGSLEFGGDRAIFIASLGLGFYVLDGLEVGVGTSAYFGAQPFIWQVTPGVKYVFWMVPTVHPYVGAFYRHWFITRGFEDLDTVGGRAGILIVPTPSPVVAGIGVVYERVINPPCREEVEECSFIYPELTFSISF